MEKSKSGFIWAANKETHIDNFWTLLSSHSSLNHLFTLLLQSRSLSVRTVILDFYLKKTYHCSYQGFYDQLSINLEER